ncbi:hypothetical protein SDC9_179299 [bioreactor metagenome]|uniref:Uncharacterized protein n=1 Tax=bioreactor metagenome TaxID=1076179 RepID=A0A645H6D0_9ZZZZ
MRKIPSAGIGVDSAQHVGDIFYNLGQSDIIVTVGQPCDNAQHIAVHRGYRLPEGYGGNRTGGVLTDTGQAHQLFVLVRQFSAEGLHYRARGFLQVAHTAVIPESLPQFQ